MALSLIPLTGKAHVSDHDYEIGTYKMKAITEILRRIRPEFDFASSDDFIGDGMLDSLDVITLVAELDKAFGISIAGVDILPENFNSIRSLERLLQKYAVKT